MKSSTFKYSLPLLFLSPRPSCCKNITGDSVGRKDVYKRQEESRKDLPERLHSPRFKRFRALPARESLSSHRVNKMLILDVYKRQGTVSPAEKRVLSV